jgi:hypothetical protein
MPDRTGGWIGKAPDLRAENITQVWIACQRRSRLKNVSANRSKTASRRMAEKPAGAVLHPWVMLGWASSALRTPPTRTARTVACERDVAKAFRTFRAFRLLAFRISDSARRGRSKHSVAEQSAALSYGAASWTLDCRAQAESNRSQVRRQRVGSGSFETVAVVRLIGLGRPSPTTVKLERTSSGQVLRKRLNIVSRTESKRQIEAHATVLESWEIFVTVSRNPNSTWIFG